MGIKALLFIFACLLLTGVAVADEGDEWTNKLSFSGYLDARAEFFSFAPDVDDSDADVTTSDIKVFEAAFAPHADLSDQVSADVVFYYVDGSNGDNTVRAESLTVDEFYLTWTNWGVFARIGKYYPPVGDYTTYGIGYTRVQDLFWTRVSAIGAGYDHDYFGLSAHVFNGDFDTMEEKDNLPDPADDTIGDFALAAHITPLAGMDDYFLEIGGYYLSDATETLFGLGSILNTQTLADPGGVPDSGDEVMAVLYESTVPLYGGYLKGEFSFGEMFGLGVAIEYATTGEFDEKEYEDASGQATAIAARHGELALLIDQNRVQVGGKYGVIAGLDWLGTAGMIDDSGDPFKPTAYREFGGFVGVDYVDGLHLALQVLAGSDNENNSTTLTELQAKIEF